MLEHSGLGSESFNMSHLSWQEFLRALVDQYLSGADDRDLSAVFGGKEVDWSGVVKSIDLTNEYAPGVSVEMDDPKITLGDSKKLIANNVFLNVDGAHKSSWADTQINERIAFSARIRRVNGPFPGVRLSQFESEPEVILLLGLEEAKRTD
ncbi:hypothetical protein [Microbulbifer sp. GL-2]|uniref:hypothetical protein n=1 Tax=Microbulbifer sp. GL-2 TaxID=2591606 RepID=UPI00117E4D59|nr:hypothetical protein [Microbulbifer sp. GL-2]